jgi:hypothetical protein
MSEWCYSAVLYTRDRRMSILSLRRGGIPVVWLRTPVPLCAGAEPAPADHYFTVGEVSISGTRPPSRCPIGRRASTFSDTSRMIEVSGTARNAPMMPQTNPQKPMASSTMIG